MKPVPEHIWKDPTFKLFLEKKKGLRESTARRYASVLNIFCSYIGKSPTEIHDLHKSDLNNKVPEYDMWLAGALDGYISYAIESGKSKSTIKANITNIKGFLHAFRLKPTPTVDITNTDEDEDPKYQLENEDIQKAIKYSNPTYQTIFTVQAQTGLAIADTLQLNVSDFINAMIHKGEDLTVREAIQRVKDDKSIVGCFDMTRKKTTNKFYTFVSHESLLNIGLLLESKVDGDLTQDSPIFMTDLRRVRFKNGEYIGNLEINEKKKLFTQDELRLTVSAFENYISRMHKERNIFPVIQVNGKNKNYFRSHKLRKWYSRQLRYKAGFSTEDTKYLMGQRTGDVFRDTLTLITTNLLKKII